MKKIALSLVLLTAFSSSVVANETTEAVGTNALYLGLGYGYLDQNNRIGSIRSVSADASTNNLLLQAGYSINKYFAVEGRFWQGVGGNDVTQTGGSYPGTYAVSNDYAWGVYIKPSYPVVNSFSIYALLGYGASSMTYNSNDFTSSDFSWGLGGEYFMNKNIAFFVDYVNIASQNSVNFTYITGFTQSIDADINIYTVNFGVTYKF